jgi:hypothetical protein
MGNAIKSIKGWLEKMKVQPQPNEQQVKPEPLQICVCACVSVQGRSWAQSRGVPGCGIAWRRQTCSRATGVRTVQEAAALLTAVPAPTFAAPPAGSMTVLLYRCTIVLLMYCLQAKDVLVEQLTEYLEQKIGFADRMLVKHAIAKIKVGWLAGCLCGRERE